MLKKINLFFCLLIGAFATAQVGGESTYQFLNLVSSPRQAALGGKVLTNVDYDVTQALFNPATINVEMDNQLAVNYTSYLGGISYGTAAYAYTYDRHVQTFHAGVNYINYGSFDGYDEDGNATGEFSGSEASLSLGYALQLGYSDFYFGTNAKFISSKLEQYNSFGVAVDLGLIYINERLDLNAALVVRNIGTQITTYADIHEKLPFEVALGVSQKLDNVPIRWHVTLENLQEWPIARPNPARTSSDLEGNQTEESIGFLGQVIRHTIVGAEFFPDKGFNVRLGYNFRRGEDLRIVDQRNFSGISAGLSIKMNKMRFSYTYAKYTSAANANFFGLQIAL
ncbi:type IX secretion system protein PorQ [Tamlana sp. 2_MG-2023]|uniref:type IX secretion system protein PorQ n=1 Tax=unclassified Tamlana TaxID=2614803 RepID=UPI0026E31286|nr:MULTISPECIES: type IX secretion system protein PorQ [unclassified Tamlana]MDO6759587.1 type IX secretion system protein PorQ [Tamlana sp. 2_MG-2023]MDO6792186.1 type IX secretion system protein PorQ [Tamlana sp. 1_MG-2023]